MELFKPVAILILSAALSGCIGQEIKSRTKIVCPVTLFDYSKEELGQAKVELSSVKEQYGEGSIVLRMMNDYSLNRSQIRICLGYTGAQSQK